MGTIILYVYMVGTLAAVEHGHRNAVIVRYNAFSTVQIGLFLVQSTKIVM